MKIAVVYARYSSDRQTEQSIEGQLHVCQDYAKRNDILIVKNYIDRAMTGTNDNREAFQQMLKDSDKRPWDYVLVYKLDRFSRNKYEMAIHRKHLKDNGIKILSAMENIPDSPEGILLESLLEGMNQYYSEELSQKTRRGLRETRMKGLFPGGRILFGYSIIDRKPTINEDEAVIIRNIFNDYANGKRLVDICNELSAQGIVNDKLPKSVNNLYYMLQNERYIGIYHHPEKTYDNIFPPIVSKEIFDIVQKRIQANKYGKHVIDVDYLLKNKAYCGFCGKPLISYTGTSCNSTIYRYYKCRSIKKKTNCQFKAFRKEPLEKIVTDALIKLTTTEKNLNLLANKIIEKIKKESADLTNLRILEKNLAQTNKAIINIVKAIEAGIFSDTTKQRLDDLEQQKKLLSEQILTEQAKERVIPTVGDIKEYIAYALSKSPKQIIDLLISKIFVYNDKVELIVKYADSPTEPTNTPRKTHNPDGTSNSERGFLLTEFYYDYERRIGKSKNTFESIKLKVSLYV